MQMLLQKVYNTQHEVTCLILKLVADIVEAHISFAQVEEPQLKSTSHPAFGCSSIVILLYVCKMAPAREARRANQAQLCLPRHGC